VERVSGVAKSEVFFLDRLLYSQHLTICRNGHVARILCLSHRPQYRVDKVDVKGGMADQVSELATNDREQRLRGLLAVGGAGIGVGSNLKVVVV
jgi:hypothetical protein